MSDSKRMRAMLMHLGSNMWRKKGFDGPPVKDVEDFVYRDEMYCEKDVWEKVTNELPALGYNTVVIDIGEGVKLDSHPEIATKGAWTKAELRAELDRLRAIGLTPIPKFNFSCAHSAWMGDWAYRVGAPEYYRFCEDIIAETIELFDTPEFFHLGLEEEDAASQHNYIAIIRSAKKKKEDFNLLFEMCRSRGVRPWIWIYNDFDTLEEFSNTIPKDVLLSPAYYGTMRDADSEDKLNNVAKFILDIDRLGYDQVPCFSNWSWHLNPKESVKMCKKFLPDGKPYGFMMATWMLTRQNKYFRLMDGAYSLSSALEKIYGE